MDSDKLLQSGNKLVFNRKKLVRFFMLAVYVLIHLFFISKHELWRDEAQAWILAKDLSLTELFGVLPEEGHPVLWFLVLRFFSHLGLPFESIGLVSLVLMSAAAALLLFSSPFPLWVQLAVLVSSAFMYYNPTISRVYALCVILVILLAKQWKDRKEKPLIYGFLIFLLFQTHVYMAGFAACLTADLFFNAVLDRRGRKKLCVGGIVGFLGMLACYIELKQSVGDTSVVDTSLPSILDMLGSLRYEKCVYALEVVMKQSLTVSGIAKLKAFIAFAIIYVLALALMFRKEPNALDAYEAMFISGAGILAVFTIKAFIYLGTIHSHTLFMVILVFFLWTIYSDTDKKKLKILSATGMALIFLMSGSAWVKDASYDLSNNYSNSGATADYICTNFEENAVVMIEHTPYDAPVYAQAEHKREDISFINAHTYEKFYYYKWGLQYDEISMESLISWLRDRYPHGHAPVYFLLNHELEHESLQLCYKQEESSFQREDYWIYKICYQ